MTAGREQGRRGDDYRVKMSWLVRFRRDRLDREPSDRAIADRLRVSPTTVGNWLRGDSVPQTVDKLVELVALVEGEARRRGLLDAVPSDAFDPRAWRRLHGLVMAGRARNTGQAVRAALATEVLLRTRPGRPLDTYLRDPFQLEVHQPIAMEDVPDLPPLPPYVRRPHDARLDRVVARAVGGTSAMAVLVAGSSTGKTRACWESLSVLTSAGGWWLWHPLAPTRPAALAQGLDHVAPHTVVWLNELQDYLAGSDDRPEEVAAKLRDVLTDPARAPVLVLATLWEKHHDALTSSTGSQVRQLLDGAIIPVPEAFTEADGPPLAAAAAQDARIEHAVACADDGRVTQTIAGARALMDRYTTARPAAKAVIHVAMDARRLWHGRALRQGFLAEAALAYLGDTDWDELGNDWLAQAFAYTSRPCKGIRGPLAPSRRDGQSPIEAMNPPAVNAPGGGREYILADYLDQVGQSTRSASLPPNGFWVAASKHVAADDAMSLALAAVNRGLLRHAAALYKRATRLGSRGAADALLSLMNQVHPSDPRPCQWVAEHVPITGVGSPPHLDHLGECGGAGPIATVLRRVMRVETVTDELVADALGWMRKAGPPLSKDHVLIGNLAARAPAYELSHVLRIVDALVQLGATDMMLALGDRVVRTARDYEAWQVDHVARALHRFGGHDQAIRLLERCAHDTSARDSASVERLMHAFGAVERPDLARDLAARCIPELDLACALRLIEIHFLYNPWGLGRSDCAVEAFVKHSAVASASIGDAKTAGTLLGWLVRLDARDRATALADRIVASADFHDVNNVALLVTDLAKAGYFVQAAILAETSAARVDVSQTKATVTMMQALDAAGHGDCVSLVAERVADAEPTDDLPALVDLMALMYDADVVPPDSFERHIVETAPVTDPADVAALLRAMLTADNPAHFAALAVQVASTVPVHDPGAAADLLRVLLHGNTHSAIALASRAAEDARLADAGGVASLVLALRQINAESAFVTLLSKRPESQVNIEGDAAGVASLIRELRAHRTREHHQALCDRVAKDMAVGDPGRVAVLLTAMRFGADTAAKELVRRASEVTDLHEPYRVLNLLDVLHSIGATEAHARLLHRAVEDFDLVDAGAVAEVLVHIGRAGGSTHLSRLLARAPVERVVLDDRADSRELVEALRRLGCESEIAALFARLSRAGFHRVALEFTGEAERYRYGRDRDGQPARRWTWDDLP